MRVYIVKRGDTVRSIAEAHGMAPMRLAEDNGIELGEQLMTGEELLIAEPTRTVYARRGDDLGGIAKRYGASEADIVAFNPETSTESRLYDGQSLAIKFDSGRYGMGIGNGYYYSGCRRDRLISCMPYLSYLTVSAAVYNGRSVSVIFDDGEVVEAARGSGKIPMLRIYLDEPPKGDGHAELASSALLLAKGRGYSGVTLAGLSALGLEEAISLIGEFRRAFIECEMKVFVEEELKGARGLVEYANGGVLFSDKVGEARIPTFEEWEGDLMRKYAEERDGMRSFIDLSPYAFMNGKYFPKREILKKLRRLKPEITRIAEGDVIVATVGRGRNERAYILESLENVRKKLAAVSEYGYYGVSFDIGRCPTEELLMFGIMFSRPITI